MGPGTVYRTPEGRLMMWVRHEDREGMRGNLWAGVDDRTRMVVTRWTSPYEDAPGELVNDTEGRREAGGLRVLLAATESERDALADAMKRATGWLSDSQAEELREVYRKAAHL